MYFIIAHSPPDRLYYISAAALCPYLSAQQQHSLTVVLSKQTLPPNNSISHSELVRGQHKRTVRWKLVGSWFIVLLTDCHTNVSNGYEAPQSAVFILCVRCPTAITTRLHFALRSELTGRTQASSVPQRPTFVRTNRTFRKNGRKIGCISHITHKPSRFDYNLRP